MTYTILSATYANDDHTAAVILTEESGVVAASEVDTPELWTKVLAASPTAFRIPADELASMVKAECQRRIYAVVDQVAQVNLAAAAAGGVLTAEQMTVYRAGLAWIAAMRAACGTLIAASDQAFAEDRHWPTPEASIVTLADAF